MEYNIETERDLQGILGQYESFRLEFKASALLTQPTDRIVKQLTEEVSSFANTEGGTLIIGIKEGSRGKKSIASEIDEGIDPVAMPPERLEQLIASNISPPVPGLRVYAVPLSGPKAGRVAYVVTVPKGTTAYQARHSLLYYGRTEFAACPLHDNVIRLLMLRGKVAHAIIELSAFTRLTAEEESKKRHAQLEQLEQGLQPDQKKGFILRPDRRRAIEEQRKCLEAPKRTFDEYSLALAIRNDGPITIRDCYLSLFVRAETPVEVGPKPPGESWVFHFLPETFVRQVSSQSGVTKERVPVRERKLFPEQVITFPEAKLTMRVPTGATPRNCTLHWTLYLEDAPSVTGVIDLTKEIRPKPGTETT